MKKIPLTRGRYAIVDDEDYGWLSRWNWYLVAGEGMVGYAHYRPKKPGPYYYMHRLIAKLMFDIPEGYEVDHINGNSLDNRRSNIRIVTHRQNMLNVKKRKDTTSKYQGVSWVSGKRKKHWYAYCFEHGHQVCIGYFHTEIEAAKARDETVKTIYGKHAHLNFPE